MGVVGTRGRSCVNSDLVTGLPFLLLVVSVQRLFPQLAKARRHHKNECPAWRRDNKLSSMGTQQDCVGCSP
eukprot:scaffold587_cov17-Prasinocladus_malaysianus.AAC.1